MKTILILSFSIAGLALVLTFIKQKLWKKENLKRFFRNENKNYIPDGIEDIVDEVKERVDNVKEELKDVKEAAEELVDQAEDVIEAAKGKKRRGRPKK